MPLNLELLPASSTVLVGEDYTRLTVDITARVDPIGVMIVSKLQAKKFRDRR